MAKRIFRNMLAAAVLAVLLTASLITFAMYSVYEKSMSAELRQEAETMVRALDMVDEPLAYLQSIHTENRLTLIADDGTVLYDNTADAGGMENHASRPEIVQAMAQGWGESQRHSDTLSEMTLYHAQKTASGTVLRIASTRSSIVGAFVTVAPLLIGILLGVAILSLFIAKRAAGRIVAPLNTLKLETPLENEAYDELAPLLSRMERQRTQIRQQMKSLENARAELAAIMENMREGLILLDSQNNVLSMNESAAGIFNVTEESSIGRNWLAVCRDASVLELVQQAQKGQSGELLWKHADKIYQVFASPVMKAEQIRGTALLIQDATERFAAENSRREFTANVSHELKTPLTSISGYAEIIRDGVAQPQDIALFAGRIHSDAQRMIALVNDILELSRLDEQQSLGQKEKVSLLPLLRGLMDDFASAAQKKRLTLEFSGGDADIEGYPTLLREMFFNLIDNAVKYTPEGGRVSVAVEQDGHQVLCRVADNGIGIPPEHQPHVFERFYRVDKSHSRATGGTGLGLAIVKHIAQVHHTYPELTSTVGEGTAVTLRFAADEQ